MRFSSAIALTVIVALASSISAMPTEGYAAGANQCIRACYSDSQCRSQDCTYYQCVSINIFLNSITRLTYMADHFVFLPSESYFCFHIGVVWPLTLMRELLVICTVDQHTSAYWN
ncbi:hypothetical protein EV424DRAFT_1384609, partial [Suillus variegatus]